MQKVFFVVPGFRMSPHHKMFKWLVEHLENKKYKVVKSPVNWKYKTLTQNSKEFEDFFTKNKGKENYILGFSYGAVITLLTANILKPRKIYLCSLSPDFKEDKPFMNKWARNYIGKRRFEDTKHRSAVVLAKNLQIPSVVLYGEGEGKKYPQLKKRCEQTARLAKNSCLVIVRGAEHNIADVEYQKSLKSVLE